MIKLIIALTTLVPLILWILNRIYSKDARAERVRKKIQFTEEDLRYVTLLLAEAKRDGRAARADELDAKRIELQQQARNLRREYKHLIGHALD